MNANTEYIDACNVNSPYSITTRGNYIYITKLIPFGDISYAFDEMPKYQSGMKDSNICCNVLQTPIFFFAVCLYE